MTRTVKITTDDQIEVHENRDPITGEAGSHPIATTIGAAAGVTAGVAASIAAGATTGSVLGPAGAIVGAIAGGIFGGGLGHAIGEEIFPTQIAWWKENYHARPYVVPGAPFSQYEPAYWYGIDAAIQNPDKDFETLEPSIRNNWNIGRGESTLSWEDASHAARDAYGRVRAQTRK